MHKLQPNQKVRILTLQIAVPADADSSVVADELSELLTGATADEASNILDWQYVLPHGGPETGNTVTVSDDPQEGEAFLPDTFLVTTFSPTPECRLHKQEVLLSDSSALELISILAKAMMKGKSRILLSMHGTRHNGDFGLAEEAGIVVRANPKKADK